MENLITRTVGFITGVGIVYLFVYIVKQKNKTAVDISAKYGKEEPLPMEKRIVRRFFLFKKLKNNLVILQYRLTDMICEGGGYQKRGWKPIRFIQIENLNEEDRKVDLYNRKQYFRDYWKQKNKRIHENYSVNYD